MIDEPSPARITVLGAAAHPGRKGSRFAGDGRNLRLAVLVALAVVLLASILAIAFAVNAGMDAARREIALRRAEDQARHRRAVEAAVREDRARATRPPVSTNPADWITSDDYPMAALRNNEEGAVTITWVVDGNGSVGDCKTLHTSGHAVLDRAACNAIMRRARYPAVPAGTAPRVFTRRVVWQIPG
jgi:TonB family protein